MNLILNKKSTILLSVMFYLILIGIVVSIIYSEYPVTRTHRGDLLGGIVLFFWTYSILFSVFSPKLKTSYQVLSSSLLTLPLMFVLSKYVSTMLLIGIASGLVFNFVLYSYRLIKYKKTN